MGGADDLAGMAASAGMEVIGDIVIGPREILQLEMHPFREDLNLTVERPPDRWPTEIPPNRHDSVSWWTTMVLQANLFILKRPDRALEYEQAARDVLNHLATLDDEHAREEHAPVLAALLAGHHDRFIRGCWITKQGPDLPPTLSHGWPWTRVEVERGPVPPSILSNVPPGLQASFTRLTAGIYMIDLDGAWVRFLTDAEADALDELAMVDTAHGRVPWLSVRLAEYTRALGDGANDNAEAWLSFEAANEHGRAGSPTLPGMDPKPFLAGWLTPWRTYNTRPALAVLALAVWWCQLRPEVAEVAKRLAEARARTHTAAMLLPFVEATERPPGVAGLTPAASWNVAVVDADLAHRMIEAGDLGGSAGQAVMCSLPSLALEAHVHDGRRGVVFNENGMQVQVQRTALGLTEVRCIGGYQALGRYLEADREAVADAVRALATFPIDWHRTMADGRTTLVLDLVDDRTGGADRGVVSFAVPRVLSPSFAGELKGRDGTRAIRAKIPMNPVKTPAPNPRTSGAARRLETAAMRWLVEHPAECNEDGGAVPWGALADTVRVSTAKQATRRMAVVDGLLELWTSSGRWVRTGDRWRPEYGWLFILEGFGKREDGRKRQAAGQRKLKRGRKKA